MQDKTQEPSDESEASGRGDDGKPQVEASRRYPFDLEEAPEPLSPEIASQAERLEAALEESVRRVQQHVLRPLAALGELEALCRSLEYGRPAPGPDDRRSLAADLQLAFTALGTHLRAMLQPAHGEIVNQIAPGLPTLLDDPGGRLHLSGVARELRRRLLSDDAVLALWRDVRAAVRAGRSEDEIALAGSRLVEIVEARGYEWRWVRHQLSQYLRRGFFDEVEDELLRPVGRSADVAWFVFGYADLPSGYLRVGQVQFFSSRLWPEAVRSRKFIRRIPGADFPEELTDHAIEHELKIDPDVAPPKLVYARVELHGDRAAGMRNPWAHNQPPFEWARDHAEALVQASTFGHGGSTWRLLQGGALHHDHGGWSGSYPIHDPERFSPERNVRDNLRDGTGEALEETPASFADRLAEGQVDARAATREVRWHVAVERQDDPAQRVALFVRGFELALPIIGDERWHGAVKRYFRDFWAFRGLADEVMKLAHDAETAFNWTGTSHLLDDVPRFIEHDGQRFTVHLRPFVDAAPSLLERFPSTHHDVRRRLRSLVRWSSDARCALRELDLRRQQFDTLLKRAARQRNAVVHGVETVPAVVATAEPFVRRLAATVVATAVEQASVGEHMHDVLERGRIVEARRMWRLEHESDPVSVILFG